MAVDFQVVIDCAQPHGLADWWAQTLGWTVEPSDEAFIRSMIEAGHAREEDTTTHRGVLVWREGAAVNSPEPGRPRLLFQLVPEGKTVKNRLHLDLRVGDDDREAAVAELVSRGATELHRGRQGPHRWATLADPEGNEFCVA
jgi:hypothetical protein